MTFLNKMPIFTCLVIFKMASTGFDVWQPNPNKKCILLSNQRSGNYVKFKTYISRVAGSGDKFSKIDRALVCGAFWNKWPAASLTALPRLESDHSPLTLSTDVQNFGASPFRYYNSYLGKPGLDDVLINALTDDSFVGSPDLILAFKLKKAKGAVKGWLLHAAEYRNKRN